MNRNRTITHSFRGISVGFHDFTILTNLNLDLYSNELVCLMGPNGSGKSTLLKTLAGLLPPVAGQIPIPDAKTQAIVLTGNIGNPMLRAREVVEMGRFPFTGWTGKLSKESEEIAKRSMLETGTAELSGSRMGDLSDGQRQLVMLARAFAQQPDLLLLDEPTSHLDLNHRHAVMQILKRWVQSSPERCAIMTTHELDLALQFADKLWVVDQGGICRGIPEDLVLNGTMDRVFSLKGFTLRTGKVIKTGSGQPIRVSATAQTESYALLWTKNALERAGYSISENTGLPIEVRQEMEKFTWVVQDAEASTIGELLEILAKSPD